MPLSTPDSTGPRVGRRARSADLAAARNDIELLTAAVTDLNQPAATRIVVSTLRRCGVVAGWNDVLAPALRQRGERFERTADGVHIEHLLCECVRCALGTVTWRRRRWNRCPPVLLAAADGEQHVMALHALAAALAEVHQPSVQLGASVPSRALHDAAAQLRPNAIFLWAQTPATARTVDLSAIRHSGSLAPAVLVVGGPGWSRTAAERVGTLAGALRACTAPTLPSQGENPPTGRGIAS